MIGDAVAQFWRDLPKPKLWKAQLCQESQLDPNARSPVGAEGLAQIMPATYQQIVRELHWSSAFGDAFNPERAIKAGAYYQGKLRRSWSPDGRTILQRNDLGLCAYNRGLGNCIKDQAECGGARLWPDIAVCTAHHTQETVIYVQRINQFWKRMESE